MTIKTLNEFRLEIDKLDKQIQKLISDRAKLALAIAKVKKHTMKDVMFYNPERESRILDAIIKRDKSLLNSKDMARIFREIMSACLALEQKLNIAYLGPEGTFTQEAVLKHFGHAVSTLDCANIDEIFNQVEKNSAHYGVAPIENSSNGVISATIDMLYIKDLKICGEVEIAIEHQLMMKDVGQNIEIIYAHKQALEQCGRWLNNHYPKVTLEAVASNALAACMVIDKKNAAAIASETALDLYNLQRVAKNIEDKAGNVTRFIVLGRDDVLPSGNDKTSFLAVTKHEVGALFDLLAPLKKANINILQLARHPIYGRKWEYLFFIDIEGHRSQKNIKSAFEVVRNNVVKMNILGSYPVAIL